MSPNLLVMLNIYNYTELNGADFTPVIEVLPHLGKLPPATWDKTLLFNLSKDPAASLVSAQCIAMGELLAFLTQQTCQQCEQAQYRGLITISKSYGTILANMIFLADTKVYLSHEFY